MKEPIAKKRSVPLDSQEDKREEANMDTVAVMCIAVVSKAEYDSMQVEEIGPVTVLGKSGQEVQINPFLLVGSSDKTREEAINRVNIVWETYKKRKIGE
jgi:hypothetical protein